MQGAHAIKTACTNHKQKSYCVNRSNPILLQVPQRRGVVWKQMQGLQRLTYMNLVETSIITASTLPEGAVIWGLIVDTCMSYPQIKMKRGQRVFSALSFIKIWLVKCSISLCCAPEGRREIQYFWGWII